MTCLALIPARGGSKGIPRKNIALFCGRPLIEWTIEAAAKAQSIDQVVVSTDDPLIAEISRNAGAEVPFLRPAELAADDTPGISPVLHALELLPYVQDLILLQPTSPLRSVEDIEQIQQLRRKHSADSAVSLCLSGKHPAWMYTINSSLRIQPILPSNDAHCRQNLPESLVLNGALFSASRNFILKEKSFVSPKTIGYIMPRERSLDLDTPFDWSHAEFLMSNQHHE